MIVLHTKTVCDLLFSAIYTSLIVPVWGSFLELTSPYRSSAAAHSEADERNVSPAHPSRQTVGLMPARTI